MQTPLDISVLYAEDDSFTMNSILSMLKKKVQKIATATNGKEGIEVFNQSPTDLIITDIKMPEMDGLSMCREIKGRRPQTQIIVTTAYSDLAYMLEAIDIGINQYVLKPIDMSRLYLAIDKCYETINLQRQLQRYYEEREALLKELQESLQKIKTLRGLVPICSSCKKVRDDKGYWEQIEAYIASHSDAEFTHCLCPECLQKLYPQFKK